MRDIYDTALTLTGQLWHSGEAIRSLTVTALYITESGDSFQQLDLLGGAKQQKNEKQEKLEGAMAAIRGKYGTGAIHFAQSGPGHGWDD
jgi:hypothetical protein